MKEFGCIVKDIKNNQVLPVYFLHGEEPFYIDKLSEFIENTLLDESEKVFNQTIVYANEINSKELISLCREFPLGSNRKLVIVKEAQHYRNSDWEHFKLYFQNIQSTTVLVIEHKYKKLEKWKESSKILEENRWIYESKKLYDNQIPNWILNECEKLSLQIDQKSIAMLVEFLGNDISKIYNELKKLEIIASHDKKITSDMIEKNTGVSKEYNIFELTHALGKRDAYKSFQIVNFFSKNDKNFSMVGIVYGIFAFFVQLMLIHTLNDKSKNSIVQLLRINPFFVDEYLNAATNYRLKEIIKTLTFIYEYDLKSKGIRNTRGITSMELLKELIYKILNVSKIINNLK